MSGAPQDQSLVKLWQAGDQDAATQLFNRYVEQLLALARKRLSQRLASRVDPEDVVQSVFRTFFGRVKAGQFTIEDPEDVCKLLARITLHKTLRQVTYHRAAKRDATREVTSGPADEKDRMAEVFAQEPTPEEANMFLDETEHFLNRIGDQDRQIIEIRMQGYNNLEIAERLGISDRKIRRLMERVRALAEQEGLAT